MPAGRPTDYKPEYCEKVIEMGKEGCSVVEMCAELEQARNTVEKEWPSKHPEFLQALEKARAYSQAWWEKQGRRGVWEEQGAPKINAGLYAKSMAARFPHDWRDNSKLELTGKDGGAMENQITVKFVGKPKE